MATRIVSPPAVRPCFPRPSSDAGHSHTAYSSDKGFIRHSMYGHDYDENSADTAGSRQRLAAPASHAMAPNGTHRHLKNWPSLVGESGGDRSAHRPGTVRGRSRTNGIKSSAALVSSTTSSITYCHIPRHKIKKVPVTSCDSCRLRKLKCNARDVPVGTPCQQCAKHNMSCTFEDRDEVHPAPKVRTAGTTSANAGRRRANTATRSGVPTSGAARSRQRDTMRRKSISDKHSPVNALVGHQASAPLLTDQDSHQQSGKVHCSSWDRWNLPAFITNVATGLSQHIKSSALVRLLVLRFFTSPSANLIIVPPREDLVSSLQAGRLEVIPDYLLQTIVACTAASEDTQEPELRLWRLQIWHSATEAAHARLGSRERPRLELIQALLLLSCNWPGPLARIERLNTFDSAINLATTMQLHNSRQPDGKNSSLRSQRQALFWALYCFDKVLSITSGRQPSIPWESHDIPLPTMEMIEELSILDQADCVWVHRLALAFVSLCRLIEDIHASLHTAHTFGWMTSMEHLLLHIRPLEARLEDFCKCQKWLLSADMSGLAPACKELTDAVVSQLHLAQLQLYLPALQFEARKNGASTGHPISFSPESAKSLAATVESAWHLVQQAPHQLQLHSAGLDAAGGATTHTGDGAMSFARACSMQGLEAFNFLGFAWKNWEGGRGCVALMPSHPVQPQHIGADHEHEQSDQNSEAQTHCTSNPASLAAAHYAFGTPQVNVAHHQPVNDLGASNHHAWQPPAGVGHQERGPAVSLRQQSGVQRGYADVQSGSMQNGSQSRRPGAPQPLTLSGVHRASTSPDDLSLRSPANELIVPEHIGRNGSSAPASKCDTAAMANMLLSTPARLLFHGTEEVPPSSGGACIGNPSPPSNKMSHITSAAGALKSRAMLTPIDTTFIEAVRQAAVEEVSSDEGGPTFPGIYEGRLESQRTGQTCRGAADINDRLSLPDSSAAMMQGRDDTTMEPHAEFHYRGSIVPAETRLNMQPMIAEAHPVPHGDADGSTSRTHNVPATDALDTQLASLDEHGSIDLDTSVDDAGSSYLANAVSLLRSTIRSL